MLLAGSLPVNISSNLLMVAFRLRSQMNGDDWNVCSEGPEVETVGRDDVGETKEVGIDGVVVDRGWRPLQQY